MKTELITRLCADHGFRIEGAHLRKGRCPECGKSELWTEAERPWMLFCARLNKCGARIPVKTLYPELFNRFGQDYPPTRQEPDATSRAYLRSRGIEPDALPPGVFVQGSRGVEVEEGKWTDFPTVKFALEGGAACHRLIDYQGKDKNRFEGSYKGRVWCLPGFEATGEVWLTEGILDALSLIQAGKAAVSVISAGHVPQDWLNTLVHRRVRLVLALDNDKAGHNGSEKLAEACRLLNLEHRLAFPLEGKDWNDLLLFGDLAPDRIETTLSEAFWRGELAQAGSAEAYYQVWSARRSGSLFEYQGCYWRGRKSKDELEVRKLSDFTLTPVFALQRKLGADKYEHTLRVRVRSQRREQEISLEPRQMTNQRDFKAALWGLAMVNWIGRQDDLDLVIEQLQYAKPTVVQEINVVGYDRDSNCYLFPDCAYGPDGKRFFPDAHGFINANGKRFFINVSDDEKTIPPEDGLSPGELIRMLLAAYGDISLAALGFYTASLFAEQFSMRPASRYFPFLSFYGPPGTGKSALVDLLNRMLGRAVDEGLSIEEVDTAKGTTRLMGSVSNLPIAILEMDKAKAKRFSMNRLLTLYNRAPLQTRANRSNDLTVNTVRFRGTLAFAQNVEQFSGEAQKGRVVSLLFKKEAQGPETLKALLRLQNLPPGQLANYRHAVLSQRGEFQKVFFERFKHYTTYFQAEGIDNTRVAGNHAVVLAGAHAALHAFLPGGDAQDAIVRLADYLLTRARDKMASLNDETDYLSLFFETVSRLIVRDKIANHCQHGHEVWLNMGEVKEAFDTEHIQFFFPKLFEEFESSPQVLFRNQSRHSPIARKTIRLYGFVRSAINPISIGG